MGLGKCHVKRQTHQQPIQADLFLIFIRQILFGILCAMQVKIPVLIKMCERFTHSPWGGEVGTAWGESSCHLALRHVPPIQSLYSCPFPSLPCAEKKDTVLRQVRLDPCDLQPIFDDMLHILNPEELRVIEEIPQAEDKLDRLFEIIGVKSQEASQTLLDSVYGHLPDLL